MASTWFLDLYVETLPPSLSPRCLFFPKQPFPTWLSRPPGALVIPDGLDREVALARDWKEMCQKKLRGCRESLCAQTSFCLVPKPDTRLLFPLRDCLTNSKLLLWLDLSETMHLFPPSLTSTDIALDLLALWVHAQREPSLQSSLCPSRWTCLSLYSTCLLFPVESGNVPHFRG